MIIPPHDANITQSLTEIMGSDELASIHLGYHGRTIANMSLLPSVIRERLRFTTEVKSTHGETTAVVFTAAARLEDDDFHPIATVKYVKGQLDNLHTVDQYIVEPEPRGYPQVDLVEAWYYSVLHDPYTTLAFTVVGERVKTGDGFHIRVSLVESTLTKMFDWDEDLRKFVVDLEILAKKAKERGL